MIDCIFCKIINKEIPAEIVYEDENTIAFLDIRPVNRGHTLVVPKTHSADFLSAAETDLLNTTKAVRIVGEALIKATNASGLNITSNNGAAAGQVIFHLHFHLIPRYSKDELKPWPHHDVEPKTRTELAEAIKKRLS